MLLEIVNDVFDGDTYHTKEGKPSLPCAISVGWLDAELNRSDGNIQEGSGDDTMTFIKECITNLIHKWVPLSRVVM